MSGAKEAMRLVSRRWSFRAIHVPWREHFQCVRAVRRHLSVPAPPPSADADVCLILPSYRRAPNLAVSVRLAVAAPSIRWVVVVNDDPERRIADTLGMDDPRLRCVDHAQRVGPVGRYLAAREVPARYYLSFDDDLFMPPEAIERLATALRSEPRVPHGFYGQRRREDGRFEDNLARFAGRVDVLNRGYAFTDAHLRRYFELVSAVGIDLGDRSTSIALDDDIVLSFCGDGRPRVHDLGPWLDCPSERRRGLARWRRSDAESMRRDLYGALATHTSRTPTRFVPAPTARIAPRGLGLSLLETASGVALARRAWHALRSRR